MADHRSGKNTHPCLQDRTNGRSPVREKYTHPCLQDRTNESSYPLLLRARARAIPAYRTAQMADRQSGKNTHTPAYRTAQMKAHIPCFLQKFHPQLNPIERVWAQLKRFTKAHCKYSFPSLRKDIPLAYDSVTVENIRHHFRKVRHYMFCYLECLTPGKELDQALLKYKTAVKSH